LAGCRDGARRRFGDRHPDMEMLAMACDDEERVVDPNADSHHRRDDRRLVPELEHPRRQADEREPQTQPDERGDQGEPHSHDAPEGDQQDQDSYSDSHELSRSSDLGVVDSRTDGRRRRPRPQPLSTDNRKQPPGY